MKGDFPSHKKDWKKFKLNSKAIALNILYVPYNTEEIRHAYKSKCNLKWENQIFFLMITDGKKWHYIAGKEISPLLRGTASKHKGGFCCLNCLPSYKTENVLKSIIMYVKIMIIVM